MEHERDAPDRRRALDKYRRLAPTYDRFVVRSSRAMRHRAVDLLELRGGEVVLDVACGTGLSFDLIERGIGPEGRLIGIDLSAEMLFRARERADRAGWENVTLVEAPVEAAEVPAQPDAVLFVLTHDVLRSPEALHNLFRQLRPGCRVVSAGAKLVGPWWAGPGNLLVRTISRRYVTTLSGLDRPWEHLERFVPDLQVESLMLGGAYVAWGEVAPPIT